MLETVIALVIGIALGAAAAWLALKSKSAASDALVGELRRQSEDKDAELSGIRGELDAERRERVAADTELKSLREQKEMIELMKKELSDTFTSLSAAALKSSNEDFLRLATESLGKVLAETKGKLGEHKEAMDGIVKPLSETLKRYEQQIREIELKRNKEYTSLDEQIKLLATTHRELQQETGNLVTALRKPHVRGRWHEITLRNVVELAGMSAHCDFSEQVTVSTEEGRMRPDMVVHMPGGHDIVVDAKVSLEALLDASEAKTEEERAAALLRHTSHVKKHVSDLGGKTYWAQFEKSPELVVCFMGEAALVAALEQEPALLEDSMKKRVLVTTPTTLFAMLSAVAYGWRQEQVTRNAEAIAKLGRELYDRINVWAKHMTDVGTALGRSTDAYNKAVGSMEARVLPSARKFKELGATGSEEIPSPEKVEKNPRSLNLLE